MCVLEGHLIQRPVSTPPPVLTRWRLPILFPFIFCFTLFAGSAPHVDGDVCICIRANTQCTPIIRVLRCMILPGLSTGQPSRWSVVRMHSPFGQSFVVVVSFTCCPWKCTTPGRPIWDIQRVSNSRLPVFMSLFANGPTVCHICLLFHHGKLMRWHNARHN